MRRVWTWLGFGRGYRVVPEPRYPGAIPWNTPPALGPSGDDSWLRDVLRARAESSGEGPLFFRDRAAEELEQLQAAPRGARRSG
jgi:hypothetical protein